MGGAVAETPHSETKQVSRDRAPPHPRRSGSQSQRQTEAADGQKQSRGARVGWARRPGGGPGRPAVGTALPPQNEAARERQEWPEHVRALSLQSPVSAAAAPAPARGKPLFLDRAPASPRRPGREQGGCALPPRAAAWGARLLPLGSSACLASLRSAAAKLEDGAAWADSALLVAGLPLGTSAPLSGEGVRGLTVAVVLVAVESIPSEGDLGSWLMPETGKEEPEVTQRVGGPSTRAGVRGAWGSGASE